MVVLDVGRLGFFRGLDCRVRCLRTGWEDLCHDFQKWYGRGWGKSVIELRGRSTVRKRVEWREQTSRCLHMEAYVDEVTVRGRAMSAEKCRVIVISGPTAVGKTQVALMLAKRLDGEIISADSVQVYKGLDVGSAKTPLDQREGVPHHSIDIVDPTEEYTAGDFFNGAREVTADILSRGRVPIVVGGTGLYLRWYLHGIPGTPRATEELTASVDAELSQLQTVGDWNAAVQLLANAGDAETACSLSQNDWYRLHRALLIVKAMQYLAQCRKSGGISSEEQFLSFLTSFQQASRNYAKRQLTWFRNEPRFCWVDASQSLEHIIEYMVDDYHKPDGIVIDSPVRILQQMPSKEGMKLLKSYKTENRIFVSSKACAPILDWIKTTQGDKIQNGAASSS